MKHCIFFALMLFSLHLGAQCIIPITEAGKTIYVPIDEIAYVVPSGSGASIVRQSGLRQLNTVESVDSIVSLCSPSLLKFTDASNGRGTAISKTFIDRIVINTQGKAVIQTKNARIAYISFEDAADLNADILSCYDEKTGGGSGSGNAVCQKTITQTAHGFSAGDVLFWDEAEGEYVSFEGNYVTATWPAYVVLSVTDANTFVGVGCGIIDEDFSLPEGLYYGTNTGLSLTPAAIEYPVLKVYNGKAQVLAMPGLEFDATGKPLFDIVTVTGQRTIDGGDTMDLHADSIRVSITIADTVATDVGHALELLKNNSGGGGISGLTANIIPKATSATGIGNGSITDDGTKVQMTKPIGLLNWATGSEPGSPSAGWIGYNSTLNFPSFRLGSTWESPLFGTWAANQVLYGSATSGRYTGTSIFTHNGTTLSLGINDGYNGRLFVRGGTSGRELLAGYIEIYSGSVPGWAGQGIGSVNTNRTMTIYSGNNNTGTDTEGIRMYGGGITARTTNFSHTLFDVLLNVGSSVPSYKMLRLKTETHASSATDTVAYITIETDHLFRVPTALYGLVHKNNVSIKHGLGTLTPSERLHVVGKIIVTNSATESAPASASVAINSTTQGFLPPRMTATQAEAIASPAEGLMVYATDGGGVTITSKGWWGYDGTAWVKLN